MIHSCNSVLNTHCHILGKLVKKSNFTVAAGMSPPVDDEYYYYPDLYEMTTVNC